MVQLCSWLNFTPVSLILLLLHNDPLNYKHWKNYVILLIPQRGLCESRMEQGRAGFYWAFTLKDFSMIWGIVSLQLRSFAAEKQGEMSKNWLNQLYDARKWLYRWNLLYLIQYVLSDHLAKDCLLCSASHREKQDWAIQWDTMVEPILAEKPWPQPGVSSLHSSEGIEHCVDTVFLLQLIVYTFFTCLFILCLF